MGGGICLGMHREREGVCLGMHGGPEGGMPRHACGEEGGLCLKDELLRPTKPVDI